jgi:hypothetical protein
MWLLVCVSAAGGCVSAGREARDAAMASPRPLHATLVHEHGRDFATGGIVNDRGDLVLRPGVEFVSGVVTSPAGFDEALISWNVTCLNSAGARFDVRVSTDGEAWSPWMYIGSWGLDGTPPGAVTSCDGGAVDIDYFRGQRTFAALQYRAMNAASAGTVLVDRVTVTLSAPAEAWPPGSVYEGPETPIAIEVPFRTQRTDKPELAGRLCSPTSVTMVLAERGIDSPVGTVSELVYDKAHDMYGVWPRNIQGAYAMGLPGELRRFSDWGEVERMLRAGTPIIASIRVGPGELSEAPYGDTDGHLIVITGLRRRGDRVEVLVNDPAATDARRGQLAYDVGDMTRVWMLNTRGTAYVLFPRPRAQQSGGMR